MKVVNTFNNLLHVIDGITEMAANAVEVRTTVQGLMLKADVEALVRSKMIARYSENNSVLKAAKLPKAQLDELEKQVKSLLK